MSTYESPLASAIATLNAESAALTTLATLLGDVTGPDATSLSAVISLFGGLKGHHGRVIVTGVGKSGHIGGKIAATLASTGTPAYFVHPTEALHGDLGMITAADAVLALSHSGESRELDAVIAYCKRFAIPLVALTGEQSLAKRSTLAAAAAHVLNTHVLQEACPMGMAPTTSTTVALAYADAIAVALMVARGFGTTDYAVFHPGGKLGAQLLHVHEIMLSGDKLPLLPEASTMQQVLITLTEKNLGSVGFTDAHGALTGIFTDGDLKRFFTSHPPESNPMHLPAATFMRTSPKTIGPEALAVSGVAHMQEQQVKDLWVVDAHRQPIGLFRLETCLARGVV